MAAVGSFETSAATPHRHSISEDLNLQLSYTALDGLGFLSFRSRCAFHLQASAAWQSSVQGCCHRLSVPDTDTQAAAGLWRCLLVGPYNRQHISRRTQNRSLAIHTLHLQT